METENKKDHKTNIAIIAIIVIALVVLVILKNHAKKIEPQIMDHGDQPTNIEDAINSDTTSAINANLDKIDVEDTTDTDLQSVDQELNNL